ncbi:MAG: ligase-associated DNA damage response endonuclease PdeM [Paracoccaceae bacterium]
MTGYCFDLVTARLVALPSGALFWPDERLLCVSDLHLGKSERLARRGGALLPPYEVPETLARLDADLERTGPSRVVCLGDSFDDLAAAGHLEEADRLWLLRLMAGRDWLWIEGNHDAGPVDLGGSHRVELVVQGLAFRHIATPARPEISGHYHPKARIAGLARPCFLIDGGRVILPAYGAYTGGLWCDAPVLAGLMAADARAVMTGRRTIALPMPRQGAARSR